MRLLLAEDEAAMSEALKDILIYHKYQVDTVDNGEDALAYAQVGEYDGIILDIMMPKMDGLQVLSVLRGRGSRTPVLLLTARGEVEERIRGLDAGADDYLTKPFAMGELLARVRAMLRRRVEYTPEILRCGEVSLDPGSCELIGCGRSIPLSRMEYLLMELLMMNQGTYLSAEVILSKVWGYDSDAVENHVEVYIGFLRKKLTAIGSDIRIESVRRLGYHLEAVHD